mgnify:CR=1 FL=1
MDHQDWDTIYMKANKIMNDKDNQKPKKEKTKDQKLSEQVDTGNFTHKKMDKNYGSEIQKLRSSKGWTQKQLAQKLNIHPKEITNIENGTAIHNGALMNRLNNLFQIKKIKKK